MEHTLVKPIPKLPRGYKAHPLSPLIAANKAGKIIYIDRFSLTASSKRKVEWKHKNPCKSNGYQMLSAPWKNGRGEREMVTWHRVVWECCTGTLPDWSIKGIGLTLDHIDNDKHNNKFKNLRLMTHRENIQKAQQIRGINQPIGIRKYSRATKNTPQKYQIVLRVDGVAHFCGIYKNKEEAIAALPEKIKEVGWR